MRRWLGGLLLAVVSTAVALAFAEVVCRVFLPEVSHTFIVELADVRSEFHHGQFPTLDTPREGAYRILFLGDSFTLGLGIPDRNHDSFPPVVEKMFRAGSVDGL